VSRFEPMYDPRLVALDDPDYVAHRRRMADLRPSRGNARAAGEYLGGLVEQCVQHWLGQFVPLKAERILAYDQRQRNNRMGTLYRELDGVWQLDEESLCLFEMKLTFEENMMRGVGLRQLDTAADIFFLDKRWKYILKRLVYVAEEPVPVLEKEPLPVVEPDDEFTELGVIWVPPSAVQQAAQDLGLALPENWLAPESREGVVDDPEREEWRQYAGIDDTGNSLADALRHLLPLEEEGEKGRGGEGENNAL